MSAVFRMELRPLRKCSEFSFIAIPRAVQKLLGFFAMSQPPFAALTCLLVYAFDRTIVEISMKIYKVPRRDRVAMLDHHRLLHDKVRERLAAISVAE